jgi:hypothetical protein
MNSRWDKGVGSYRIPTPPTTFAQQYQGIRWAGDQNPALPTGHGFWGIRAAKALTARSPALSGPIGTPGLEVQQMLTRVHAEGYERDEGPAVAVVALVAAGGSLFWRRNNACPVVIASKAKQSRKPSADAVWIASSLRSSQ